MLTRRHFIATAAASTVAAIAAPHVLANVPTPGIGSVLPTKGTVSDKPLPTNTPAAGAKYRPAHRFGFGGAPLGNNHAPIPANQAEATLQAAWDAGVRLYDTSPWYGLGLSERRFGQLLHQHKPDDYILCTKVGRVLTATRDLPKTSWKEPSPFAYRYDYSADGVRRSIEDSLQRLGVPKIDIVYIHDVSPDNGDMKDRWTEYYEQAVKGAMPALTKMREEGIIKAWGFGINRPDALVRALKDADPDIFLLATQYSLVDHQEALDVTFPALAARGISVMVGAPLNAGFLAGRARFNYLGQVPEAMLQKRDKISAVADQHGVDLRTASLQFAAASPVVSAIIPGARTSEQVKANVESMRVAIPAAFWAALKSQRLIAANAPVP